jgi:hypothetical protein
LPFRHQLWVREAQLGSGPKGSGNVDIVTRRRLEKWPIPVCRLGAASLDCEGPVWVFTVDADKNDPLVPGQIPNFLSVFVCFVERYLGLHRIHNEVGVSSMERADITTQKPAHQNPFFGSSLTDFNLSDGSQIGRTPSQVKISQEDPSSIFLYKF